MPHSTDRHGIAAHGSLIPFMIGVGGPIIAHYGPALFIGLQYHMPQTYRKMRLASI